MIFYFLIGFIVLCIIIYIEFKYILELKEKLKDLISKKQSLSTRYGQIFEQLVPFAESFPYDVKNFRFIGDPIDGIVFDENKVVFCEIKLHKSQLTSRQRKIRDLIKDKKVEWLEIGS